MIILILNVVRKVNIFNSLCHLRIYYRSFLYEKSTYIPRVRRAGHLPDTGQSTTEASITLIR
jgi:hypothetical protein